MPYNDNNWNGYMSWTDVMSWLGFNSAGFGTGRLYEDFPEEIAQKAARLTYGKGLIINSENPKVRNLLNKWMRENDVLTKLRKSEYVNSKFGKAILFLTPSKDGKNVVLTQVKNNYQGRVAKVNEEEQVAELWNQDSQGDYYIYTKTSITPTTIKVEYYTAAKSRIGSTESDIQPELDLKRSYTFPNRFGRVPVVEMENLVVNNMWGQTVYNCRPDWEPVMNTIESYNITYRTSVVETKANRTRYIGQLTPQDVEKIQNKKADYAGAEDLMGDAYLNVSFNDTYAHGTQGAGLTIAAGDPKLDVYTSRLEAIRTAIFNGAGYSPVKSGDVYQNQTDSVYAQKLDIETTLQKREYRKEKLARLFDCVLAYYGIEPIDADGQRIYNFDFVELDITDKQVQIDETQKMIAMGVITTTEARSKLLNEPLDVAEEAIKKVKEEQDEQAKADMKYQQMTQMKENTGKIDQTKGKLGE